ncbi:polysaccharide deacetylase family protein [Streptomyces sp. NK08204]|uniref:polysaccharide deacetylase family protein n=1 Tax=Streptomyces sp. NK08204 TaxID=2873260 RepID=UPI001CEC6256|nr:polysaccharide deacetylase family protein [Streptomyces sp. NK08204]
MRRGGSLRCLAAVLAPALLLTGCAQSVDPIERLGKKAAQRVRQHGPDADEPYRHWGLAAPLTHPPARPARPLSTGSARAPGTGPAPVLDHVATRDKVVFLTYDDTYAGTFADGAEQDPRFIDMVRELRLPVSMFVTGAGAGHGRAHTVRLSSAGAGIENRTRGHQALPGVSYAEQRAEICAQQHALRSRLGLHPRLLRPPYGAYDAVTLRAAAACGISAVVLWRAAMGPRTLTFTRGPHLLRPGDIVSLNPDGASGRALRERTTRLLRSVQERGLTVARLEDYL